MRRCESMERGAALPLVLVVTLAMVLIVSDLALRTQLSFERSRRAMKMIESRSLLKKIEDGLSNLTASQLEVLADGGREFSLNDFEIKISAEPTESKININRLDDLVMGAPVQELFAALLKRERFEQRAPACALDWVDADNEPRPSGAERLDYSGEDVTPRNAPFETVDELTFVRGFSDPSAFDRIRPMLTAYGSGKIYIPAVSDEMLDLFEDVYGIVVRNTLEDIRRNPGRKFQLPAGMLSGASLQTLQSLIVDRPTAWQITVTIGGRNFHSRSVYVLVQGDDGAGQASIFRRLG